MSINIKQVTETTEAYVFNDFLTGNVKILFI